MMVISQIGKCDLVVVSVFEQDEDYTSGVVTTVVVGVLRSRTLTASSPCDEAASPVK